MISDSLFELGYRLLDRGQIPDFILKLAIRAVLRQRLREIDHGSLEANHAAKMDWIAGVKARMSIADVPDKANEQHYEISTDFILSTLGPNAKYSSGLYPTGQESLGEAEILMLENYCEKAHLENGLDILDLGCGWGSLSLFLAQKYPNSRIVGLSNSTTQKVYIEKTAISRGVTNLEIITADINTHKFDESRRFDRIVSTGMFEHMKNYQILFKKMSTWLKSHESLVFISVFCHISTPYHFEEGGGWMAENFFSGGTMPSFDLFTYFQDDLTLIKSWYLSGINYSRTAEDWLKTQDQNKQAGLEELRNYAIKRGSDPIEAEKIFYRFRVFYMACSELFRMNEGQEWGVGHYLFRPKK
ncbi:S-adenosyl-L-methionine-dependent methyltransferase [Marasmius fiardii PR-910]|nr:S-adenosyl-L-methionine-dependent methyltransferase [Marasmius fiardii PR-910]